MHPFNFLSSFNTSLRRSECFVLRFTARPFSGLFGKVDTPPIKFSRLLARLASALGFLVYKVRSLTPWILPLSGLSAVSDLDNLRVNSLFVHLLSCGSPLCSWGNDFDCFFWCAHRSLKVSLHQALARFFLHSAALPDWCPDFIRIIILVKQASKIFWCL